MVRPRAWFQVHSVDGGMMLENDGVFVRGTRLRILQEQFYNVR